MEMKKFNYTLEINILRNSSQIFLGVLRGVFQGFGCPKRHPDALLAKTMTVTEIYSFIFACAMQWSTVISLLALSHPIIAAAECWLE